MLHLKFTNACASMGGTEEWVMYRLENWFLKHQERQQRFASLNDLMFAESLRRYPQFRLSLFNFQVIFHFVAHAFFFYFLFHELGSRTFTLVIYISSVKMLITAGWWGGLELLRSQVRYAYRTGNLQDLEQIIGCWLILTGLICSVVAVFGLYMGWVTYQSYLYHRSILEPLYATIACLMIVIRLPVSTFHAGIYGISRVIRPHFSVILGYIFGLAVLFIAWSRLGVYAIFLGILTQSVTSSLLTYHYGAYMYELYNFWPKKTNHHQFWEFAKKLSPLHFLLASVSNIFMFSDALLIIGFYFFNAGNPGNLLFLQIVYLISPLIQASTNWARLFYFDRKRLRNSQLNLFIDEYDRAVACVALILGFAFGVYATIACTILISDTAGLYVLTMLPFFLLRSMIANLQIRDFSYFYYYDVIVSGLVLVLGLVGIYLTTFPPLTKFLMVALLMIVVHAFLKRTRFPEFQSTRYQGLFTNLYTWIAHLKKTPEFVELYRLELDPYIKLSEKVGLVKMLSAELGLTEHQICSVKDTHLLIFRRMHNQRQILTNSYFVELGTGLIKKVERHLVSEVTLSDGETALSYSFDESPILQDIVQFAYQYCPEEAVEGLEEEHVIDCFLGMFPNGTYYNPKKRPGPEAEPLPIEIVRKFTTLVWQYLFQQRKRVKAPVDVTVWFDDEMVKVIFVVPKKDNDQFQQTLQQWHNFIHAVNIKSAMES